MSNLYVGQTNLTSLIVGPGSLSVLSSTDLLSLNTTPVILIPAQGANTIIVVLDGFLKYTFKGVPYTIGGAGLELLINGNNIVGGAIPLTGTLDQTHDVIDSGSINLGGNFVFSTLVNQPVTAQTTGPLTAGNGTLTIGFWYSVVNL